MATSSIVEAVNYLERGDWKAAHALVQSESGTLECWAHGIVHLVEGDLDNARYWYRRAERDLPDGTAPIAEIAALKSALAAGTQ